MIVKPMQWRLENTNNQLIQVITAAGYLPWIMVQTSFVIWATAICHPECCRLFPAWLQMRDYCHQPTTSSTLSLNRECIGRAHKMPPCVPRAVRAVQKDVSQRKCFNCPKLCYGHSTNPSMEVEMRKSWAPIHFWFKEVSLTYGEKQKCRHNWKSIKAK